MDCPLCRDASQVSILETRPRRDGSLRRRRECRRCRARWTTSEVLVDGPTLRNAAVPQNLPEASAHCSRCQQWSRRHGNCGLGFPEAQSEADFARSCLHYQAAA